MSWPRALQWNSWIDPDAIQVMTHGRPENHELDGAIWQIQLNYVCSAAMWCYTIMVAICLWLGRRSVDAAKETNIQFRWWALFPKATSWAGLIRFSCQWQLFSTECTMGWHVVFSCSLWRVVLWFVVLFSTVLLDTVPTEHLQSWTACNRGCFVLVRYCLSMFYFHCLYSDISVAILLVVITSTRPTQ